MGCVKMNVCSVCRIPILCAVKRLWSAHLSWVTLGLEHWRANTWNNGVSESEKGSTGSLPHHEPIFSLHNTSAVTVSKWTVSHQRHHKLSLKTPELLTTGSGVTASKPVSLRFEITAGFPCFIMVCPSPGTTFAQELLRLVNIVCVSWYHQANRLALWHINPQSC